MKISQKAFEIFWPSSLGHIVMCILLILLILAAPIKSIRAESACPNWMAGLADPGAMKEKEKLTIEDYRQYAQFYSSSHDFVTKDEKRLKAFRNRILKIITNLQARRDALAEQLKIETEYWQGTASYYLLFPGVPGYRYYARVVVPLKNEISQTGVLMASFSLLHREVDSDLGNWH